MTVPAQTGLVLQVLVHAGADANRNAPAVSEPGVYRVVLAAMQPAALLDEPRGDPVGAILVTP
ncbi:MAG: hypothetical protein U0531_07820 [Dehalococcoidia bacterium]